MRASTSLPPQGRQGIYSFPLPARLPLFCVFSPRLDAQRRQQAGGTGPGMPQPLARAGPAACCCSSATQAGAVTVPVSEPVTARVPGPARVGFRVGPGNGHPSLIICDLRLLGCKGKLLRGIYTSLSSCKKAVINVSHSMSVAHSDQPHSPPEQLSSISMLADGHAVS